MNDVQGHDEQTIAPALDNRLRRCLRFRGSHQRRTVYRRSRLLVLREPDLFSVSREPGLADHRPRRRPKFSFRQVGERPAADLTDEDIERSIAVREKDHELAIRGDRGIDLLALEVGQTHGPRISQRVLPEIIRDPQAPGDAHRGRQTKRGDERTPIDGSTSGGKRVFMEQIGRASCRERV